MDTTTQGKKFVFIGIVVCGFALSLIIGAQAASANHSWGGYHWARTANPLKLSLGDNVSGAWDAHLAAASADWSLSSVLDTTVVPTKSGSPRSCRATGGRVEVCNALYGKTGWLGIASVWVSGGHITQGTVRLNDTYYRSAPYNTAAWRQFVVCQEIGHTFGLDHQDETFGNTNLGTCMDYTNNPTTNQHPNDHDYAQLETIYAHLDGSNTAAQQTTSAGADIDPTDPRSWGTAVRPERSERESLYERRLSSGEKVFTFVVWANEGDQDANGHAH